MEAEWDPRPALGVVMAAGGYPDSYHKGDIIVGLQGETGADCKVFHAGTRQDDGAVVTSGGRVLCVTALGSSVAEAQGRAYQAVAGISWRDAYWRRDIGHRAIHRSD
jgi:phosphoribosylamine--glycine ligase